MKPTSPLCGLSKRQALFAALVGIWLAAVVVKFGNPVIFPIARPESLWELALASWPLTWGYCLLGLVVLAAFPIRDFNVKIPKRVFILLLVWFGCQLLSAIETVNIRLTATTISHFSACLTCFCLGAFALGRVRDLSIAWLGLLLGFSLVLGVGLDQHFGGLEQMRRAYETVDWTQLPPGLEEYLKAPEFRRRISSDRIFSTFIYPNTLAGAILLFLPMSVTFLWRLGRRFPLPLRCVPAGSVALSALACLFWSGSKAGWLILIFMGLPVIFNWPFSKRIKYAAGAVLLMGGLAGLYLRHSDYFSRGATSISARTQYWRAGWTLVKEKPLLGSGPGTFMIGYERLKTPEAEMARLAHNDYLQQASDSGLIAFAAYTAFLWGSLGCLYGRLKGDAFMFAVWSGVSGLAMQSAVEFGLYVPALSWPQFLFLGWLWTATSSGSESNRQPFQGP